MGAMRWLRGGRTTSIRAVSLGLEMVHAVFNGNKVTQVSEREKERRVGTPSRLSPGDPGAGPLDLPQDWRRRPEA
jgi:hypothetical protein